MQCCTARCFYCACSIYGAQSRRFGARFIDLLAHAQVQFTSHISSQYYAAPLPPTGRRVAPAQSVRSISPVPIRLTALLCFALLWSLRCTSLQSSRLQYTFLGPSNCLVCCLADETQMPVKFFCLDLESFCFPCSPPPQWDVRTLQVRGCRSTRMQLLVAVNHNLCMYDTLFLPKQCTALSACDAETTSMTQLQARIRRIRDSETQKVLSSFALRRSQLNKEIRRMKLRIVCASTLC